MATRVLIVEDSPLNMLMEADVLELNGFIVLQAQTAEQAITIAEQERPDVVLMDIALPGMDGLTATRLLKANPGTSAIPVIAVTAHAMRGDAQRAIDAGCVAYITKPIDTSTFPDQVARVAEASLRER